MKHAGGGQIRLSKQHVQQDRLQTMLVLMYMRVLQTECDHLCARSSVAYFRKVWWVTLRILCMDQEADRIATPQYFRCIAERNLSAAVPPAHM